MDVVQLLLGVSEGLQQAAQETDGVTSNRQSCGELNEALEAARSEMTRLHGERDQYEETMKKAFMRGVCALNLEAMSMFHQGEQGGSSAAQKLGSRTITAKVTAKQKGPQLGQAGKGPGSVAMGLAPPMSSVMVERHHPVTQQTIGHATADRYPRMPSQSQQPLQQSQSTIAQRKVAGQAGKVHLGTPNVHSVKVVQ
uniref:Centrosomal protein POC5 n=1 Tax=Branchiostoma floridae TaxID=7739 RepID=C3ZJY5_BRAFL|eukprot:XP_002591141.1 hypothetical protein BRAFLDRAFT_105512 [Branchiostoma floridae]